VPNRLGRSDDTGAMLPSAANRSWDRSISKVGTAPPVTSGMVRSRLSVLGKIDSSVLSGMLTSELPALPRSDSMVLIGNQNDTSGDPRLRIALHEGSLTPSFHSVPN
jgi:hypothetical protein